MEEMSNRLPALALALVSLVAAAWFGLGIHQAHDIGGAAAIVAGTSHVSPGQARHAGDLLRSASVLNPDDEVDILRGELALDEGNRVAARRIFEQVGAKEPENALAWEWLARASPDDAHDFFQAIIHLRELVPRVPSAP